MKRSLSAFALIFALASSMAIAQSNGPDVIVGSIPNEQNYSSNTTLGLDAFSIATTSCNIGNAPLLWISSNNQHPVIGQTAFRLHNGRFEQIGQSWLKHGFFALAGSLCDPCTGPSGSQLDPGCSDPYGASLNGSQSGLGPKFEINAFTGAYPYPFSNPNGSTGNSIFKRLQIAMSDLNSSNFPGARYFVASQYVSPDDAAAGNQMNNASHRECTFSGGPTNYNMNLIGSTVREKPAITAWQDIDPTVELDTFDAPQDGRFYVGFKHTDLGNGDHVWEFAVHNLNSHRSGRSFTVNLPAGASASSLEFNDVSYHSGEPYSGTDWSGSTSGGTVSWNTQTFAQNQNANALRWGTLYNFRFICDQPPVASVSGSIGLFRPGPGGNSVNWNLGAPAAPTIVTVTAGDNQYVETGDAFPQDLEVTVTQSGAPVANAPVVLTEAAGGGAANFPGGLTATTNASGVATFAVSATTLGEINITATSGVATDTARLYSRGLSRIWIPGANTLFLRFYHGVAGIAQVVAVDDPSVGPITTLYGDLYTSILNPGPSFYAESGDPSTPNAFYRPSLVTDSNGFHQQIYTNLMGLSGVTYNHQAYAISTINGSIDVWISDVLTATY